MVPTVSSPLVVILTCFKCGRKVKPDEAVHTKDGRVACPDDAELLGLKVEKIEELREVTRMVERSKVETEREELRLISRGNSGNAVLAESVVEALDWVLGESRWAPTDKLR